MTQVSNEVVLSKKTFVIFVFGITLFASILTAATVYFYDKSAGYHAQIDEVCNSFLEISELSPALSPELHVSCNSDGKPKAVLVQRHMADGSLVMRVVKHGGETASLTLGSVK